MNEKLRKLAEEKALYEEHNENHILQQQELESIAKAILVVSEELTNELTDEEKDLIEWAHKFQKHS